MRSSSLIGKTALMVSLVWVVSVQASLLLPGTTIYPAPSEPDPVGGSAISSPLTLPFASSTFTGTLTTTIISGDTSNPWNGLTFVYDLTNDVTSIDAIHRLTVNGYGGFSTDASYQAVIGDQEPALVDRSLNGDVVGFGFLAPPLGSGHLPPGSFSARLVVRTDAPAYRESFASVINGSVTSVGTYSPIPEPMTVTLMIMGAGLALLHRR